MNNLKIEIKTFTPEEAENILAHYNNLNRRKKPTTISVLVKDLEDDKYFVNGETIKFATDGTLLDGQNRLAACARAGKPLTSIVVYGVDKQHFDTIDVGMPRTGGDILYTQREPNAAVLAASLNLVGLYEQGKLPNGRLSKQQLRPLLEANPTIRESVGRIVDHDISKQKLASKNVLSFLHYMFLKVDKEKAESFFDRLEDGQLLPKEHPVLVLRAILTKNAASNKKLLQDDIFALCLKAWHAFFNDRTIKSLQFSRKREQFPGIAGLDDLLGNDQVAA